MGQTHEASMMQMRRAWGKHEASMRQMRQAWGKHEATAARPAPRR